MRPLSAVSAVLFALTDGRLRRSQTGDRDAVGGAADVVETHSLAERDRGRVAAVLAADAELDVRLHRPATLGGDADQVADAFLIEGHERVLLEDALVDIGVQETA